ncbi:MAG TPA: type II secretion system F family protein [Patescibacteria group bacterium]|jgi:type IV pilus assembly protein PilC|nr:type II secretion system F family protein [Patescibacteria group bacterium]
MSIYLYEATHSDGTAVRGELEADSEQTIIDYLSRRSLIPVKIEEKGVVKTGVFSKGLFEKITTPDRILLVRNLGTSIRAGLSITEALDILIADNSKKLMKDILEQAKINVQNGHPLSATFLSYKQYFPSIFVGMIKAGEAYGHLDDSLDQLGRQLTKDYNVERKIKSAMTYPMILLVGSAGAVTLLLGFVLPRLAKTFKQSGVKLPFITQTFVNIGSALSYSITLDLIVIVFLVWFFIRFRKTNTGRKLFSWFSFHMPVIKEMVKKASLVRFTRSLGNLIASGIPITEALNLSAESVGNDRYKKAIMESKRQIIGGVPFSKTFEDYPELFPKFLTSLMLVGEKTGTLENILKVFSDFYEEELDNALKDLATYIEPILLLIMGLIVGAIAFSILLPIYQLVGKFT